MSFIFNLCSFIVLMLSLTYFDVESHENERKTMKSEGCILTRSVITAMERQFTLFYSFCACDPGLRLRLSPCNPNQCMPEASLRSAWPRHWPWASTRNKGEKCRLLLCLAKRGDPPGLLGAGFFHPLGRTLRRYSWEKEQPFRSRGLATSLPLKARVAVVYLESTLRKKLPRASSYKPFCEERNQQKKAFESNQTLVDYRNSNVYKFHY